MRYAVLLTIWFACTPAFGLEFAQEASPTADFNLAGSVGYYIEEYNEQKPHEALDLLQHGYFTFVASSRLSLGYTAKAVWIALPYQVPAPGLTLYLEITSLIDSIQFSQLSERGLILDSVNTGRDSIMSTRSLSHHNFVFTVKPSRDVRGYLLMRLKSEGSMLLPLRLTRQSNFFANDHIEQLVFGLYFGIMLVMVLYNLFLYASTRDRSYAFYVFYILFFLLFQFSLWGFTHELLLPNSPKLAKYSLPIFLHLTTLFQLLFATQFFQSKSLIPRQYKLSGYLSFVTFASLAIGGFLPYRWFVIVGILTGAGAALAIFYMGLSLYMKKVKAARFFLIAYATLIFGILLLALRNFGIINYSFLSTYSAQIGSALEVVLLSLALADKINLWRDEKEAAQKHVIDREREMNRSFARFVPQKFLELAGENDFTKLELGKSTTREITILFSDIRKFTTLSESMTPEQNFKFLNSYLSRMGPIIRAHGGFIDKFIGDAIMALFPGEPKQAIAAALAMRQELRKYNAHRESQAYQAIDIGIGIHTGEVRLGTIGENERWEGTVIGDTVNTASRIEGLTSVFAAPIVISAELLTHLPTGAITRELDRIKAKGKNKSTAVYEVLEVA